MIVNEKQKNFTQKMSLGNLPSALVSNIAESLNIKNFASLNRASKTIKRDLKDNWARMAKRDLGIDEKKFYQNLKKKISSSELYRMFYFAQKELIRQKIKWVRDVLNRDGYDSYDVYKQAKANYKVDERDTDTTDIELLLDFKKELLDFEKEKYDEILSEYGENWIHVNNDDVREVLRTFYKTEDDAEIFVMANPYPWLQKRYENIDRIAEILGDEYKYVSSYLAGKGIEPSEITPEMEKVALSYDSVFPPYFLAGLTDEDEDLEYDLS